MGSIVNGKLFCTACVTAHERRKEQRSHKGRMRGLLLCIPAGGAVAWVVLIMVQPGLALLTGLLASAAAILAGMLGLDFQRSTRWALVLTGCAACGLSAWGLIHQRQTEESSHALQQIDGDAQHLERLLEQDLYPEAQRRLAYIERKLKNPAGVFISPAAANRVKELRGKLDAWMLGAYGTLTDRETRLLREILSAFSAKTASGNRRILGLQLQGETARMTASVSPGGQAGSAGENAASREERQAAHLEEARIFAVFLFQHVAEVQSVEIELTEAPEEKESRPILRATAKRSDLQTLLQGDLEAMSVLRP